MPYFLDWLCTIKEVGALIFDIKLLNKMFHYSFVPNFRELKLQILGKNPSGSFNDYKRMT